VGHLNGIMFNWSFALGAWALAGPVWGVATFLAIALVRVSVDAQALRHDNAELKRRLGLPRGALSLAVNDVEAPPESEIRPSQTPSMANGAAFRA